MLSRRHIAGCHGDLGSARGRGAARLLLRGQPAALTRPFTRLWSPGRPQMDEKELFGVQDAPQTLVIPASDAAGVSNGVDELAKLLQVK